MDTGDKRTKKRSRWMGIIVMLAALLVASAGPSSAWGGRGFGGFHGGFHGFGGPRIAIGVGPFWGPYWGPYAYPYAHPYAYPPVVVAPSTQLFVAPPPQASWYYCDHPTGYYPYVQQCPGGGRPVDIRVVAIDSACARTRDLTGVSTGVGCPCRGNRI